MLRNESTYRLPLNKNTYRAIKMQTGTNIDVEKYLNDCMNEYRDDESGNGLFNTDKKTFWSASLLRRMEKYETLKEKRSQAANTRWNKQKEKSKKQSKNAKLCKCIKNICKCITLAKGKQYTCNANLKKVYAKLCKLNQIKSNQIKLNKIKDIKSIYPSNHIYQENKNLDKMMDEMDKIEFERVLNNCELHKLAPELAIEITEILKEMYINTETREKTLELNCKKVLYALHNFAIANTKTRIQIPKQYFKKCLLSALQQTELSEQFDIDVFYETEDY
ncbi:MAG: hypothetical protein IKM97_04855 [Clostridia bacterium]|nr:hypothetical protein [Clostridia bacterium]